MQAAILSIFRSSWGLFVFLAVLALAVCVLFKPHFMDDTADVNVTADNKPKYDLIFGVFTFNPDLKTNVVISPYVTDGTLYIEAEKLPANEGTVSTWVMLYHYNSKTGIAQQLPLPSARELQNIAGKHQFVFTPTQQLTLDDNETSPDGYSLAEPNWGKVNPISNLLGNITMFIVSGRFGTIKKRESTPRLAKDSASVAMKSDGPIFKNEADNAFLLGWVVPDSSLKSGKKR